MAAQKGKPAAQPKKGAENVEEKMDNAIGRTEQYLYNNGKKLLTVLLVVVLVIGGYMWYKYLYQTGRTEKASEMMFVAQQNLAEEMYEIALAGDGMNAGFLDVISKYGSTPQGNIANHYAGECYAKLGLYEDALRHLEQYKQTKGVPNAIVNAQNYGLRGDIYVQLEQTDKAAEMFAKAVKAGDNTYTSPMYLKKLGQANMALGRKQEAMDAFQRILDEYPMSMEARDTEKFMGAIGQM